MVDHRHLAALRNPAHDQTQEQWTSKTWTLITEYRRSPTTCLHGPSKIQAGWKLDTPWSWWSTGTVESKNTMELVKYRHGGIKEHHGVCGVQGTVESKNTMESKNTRWNQRTPWSWWSTGRVESKNTMESKNTRWNQRTPWNQRTHDGIKEHHGVGGVQAGWNQRTPGGP